MNIETFTQEERGALHECVAAIRASATYELPKFEKIFGSTKEEIEEVYATFPNWDLYDETPSGYDASGDVIRNTFALLLNGHEEEKKAILATLNFDLELIPQPIQKAARLKSLTKTLRPTVTSIQFVFSGFHLAADELRRSQVMKTIISLVLTLLLIPSCVSSRIGSGGWPERTRDSKLDIEDTHQYLSKSDINTIHDVVWTKNANLRIFSIRVVKPRTVLVICTDVPGDRFSRSIGFDMIKTGNTWKFGTFKGKVTPM